MISRLSAIILSLFFLQFAIGQTITIVNPNGGENLHPCEQYLITWNTTGSLSNYYNIDYSLDGGTIWASVSSNYLSTNGTFWWTVPNVQSNTCLIRVRDAQNSSTVDISDSLFIINIPIIVTSPNGGENWVSGTTHNITWDINGTNNNFDIHYSVNGGTTWVSIVNNYNTSVGSYAWQVPLIAPSTNCLIRVRSSAQNCMFDISNAVFTISPPQPLLLTPNGGETWYTGCSYNITWDPSTFYTNVVLEYSKNNGVTWNTISVNSNNGIVSWAPPTSNLNETDYLIKIYNQGNPGLFDVSNDTFRVPPTFEFLNPLAGDTIVGCSTFPIQFVKSCEFTVNLKYSLNNGTTWTNIINNWTEYNYNTTRVYNWTVPNPSTPSNIIFRVESYSNNSLFAVSQTPIYLVPSNEITITSPLNNDTLASNSSTIITWTNTPNVSGTYQIRFFDGSSWSTIASNITGNSYAWNVPPKNSSSCVIEVRDQLNNCKLKQQTFTITPPQPVLLTPNGGETWYTGCSYNITWDPTTFYTNVVLEYSNNNGATWNTISNAYSNSGIASWAAPFSNLNQTDYLIKIYNQGNPGLFDVSNDTFRVPPTFEFLNPLVGDTIVGCSTLPIQFVKSCDFTVNLKYSLNNGTTWTNIITNWTEYNYNTTRVYNWPVPNPSTATNIIFKVESYSNSSLFAVTQSPIYLVPSNEITITSPLNNDTLASNSSTIITWTNTPNVSGTYQIRFFDGSSWSTLASNVTGNSYAWNVPPKNSSSCIIEVRDQVNNCKLKQQTFTITPPQPLLLTPNGGETWYTGCSYNITWDPTTFYTNVVLEYSNNNGATWNTISNAYSNSGIASWAAPFSNLNQTDYLIKIYNQGNPGLFDVSNDTFRVPPTFEFLNPLVGDTIVGCSTLPIQFVKSCDFTVNLKYSLNNGTTWTNIITNWTEYNYNTTRVYNWPVPNPSTPTNIIFKVESYSNSSLFAVTQSPIYLVPSNEITITSPQLTDTIPSNTTHLITWTNTPNVSGTYIVRFFNGASWTTLATNVTGNSYNFTAPVLNSSNCKIEVRDQLNSCKIHEVTFTISPPQPILLSPNGGESFYSQTTQNITWTVNSLYTNVALQYSIDSGLTWTNIITSTSNDGSHPWIVPEANSQLCLVRIFNVGLSSLLDVSDQVFQIKPAVTILTPNGDNGITQWGGCTVTSITFDHTPALQNYNFRYSIDNGATWTTIQTNRFFNTNPSTYNWNIPNISSSNVLVEVAPTANTLLADVSDSTFTVTKPVTITQPNFGGIMQVGSIYNIIWSSDGISNLYNIDYSTNNGATWTNIVTGYNTSNNTYPWLVPNTVSNNCRIRITDFINSCKSDISAIAFIISPTASPITLTAPNGIDTISGCEDYLITWTETSTHGSYNISYSSDLGNTYIPIVNNYSTTSSNYTWHVPNITSNQILIKVAQNGTANFDLSDALFAINPSNLNILNNDTTIYNGTSFLLQATGTSSYSWSPATGLSNPNIANPIASPSDTTTYIVSHTSGGCLLQDSLLVNVEYPDSASVFISTSDSTICEGSSLTFYASPNNEGTNPIYQWYVNNMPVGFNVDTLHVATILNNDEIKVELTSNKPGVLYAIDTSDVILITVLPNLNPQISISSNLGTTLCANNSIVISANVANEGNAPNYQWYLNNVALGNNSSILSLPNLTQGDEVFCVLNSSETCVNQNPISSDTLMFNVNPLTFSSVSIEASEDTICENTNVVFTAFNTGDGLNPSYQWKINGNNVGTNDAVFQTNTLLSTDQVQVEMQASGTCLNNPTSVSNILTIQTLAYTTPNASISSNTSNTFCLGSSKTFIAAVQNEGSNPLYQWFVNGQNQNVNDTIFSSSTLQDGDSIYFVLNTSEICTTTPSDTSNVIYLEVNDVPNFISGILGDTLHCEGAWVTYNVSAQNADVFTWSTPNSWLGTSDSASILLEVGQSNGNITVFASNACGNSPTQSLAVTSNLKPLVNIISSDTAICLGEAVTLNGSGAATYVWNNGVIDGQAFTPSASASYIVVGTDANLCSASDTITVAVNALPNVVANATETSICLGETVSVFGSGALSYTWNNGVSNNQSFSLNASANYTVTGTDANTCVNTASIFITVNALPLVLAGNDTALCENSTLSLAASGANSYVWSNGLVNAQPFAASTTTTYTVVGTDANACSNTDSVVVTVWDLPNVQAQSSDAAICLGEAVTLSGSGAATYVWNNGVIDGQAFNPNASTSYIVVGTDANLCSASDTIAVGVNALPNVIANATETSICLGETVSVFGSGALSYTWNNGVSNNQSFSPNASANYTVTGTDANTCVNTASVFITVNALPLVFAGNDTALCENSTLSLAASGASSYVWNNGLVNAQPFAASTTTTFTVVGTDANACSNTDSVIVTVWNLPNVQAQSSDAAICLGEAVTLNGSGAASYVWNNGVIDGQAFTPSATASYIVVGTDTNLCSSSDTIAVVVNVLPNVVANATETSICLGETVSVFGSGALSYTWNNGVSNNQSFSPNASANYTVTGTDANSCVNTASVFITVNALPLVFAGNDTALCENSTLSLAASGANSYVWNNGVVNAQPFAASTTTTYTVVGTDANACSNTDSVIVTVWNLPNVQAQSSDAAICLGEAVTLNGSGATSYVWNNGVIDGQAFNPSASTSYIVVGTDANLCSASDTIAVGVNALPIINLVSFQDELLGSDGFIDINVIVGTQNYSLNWSLNGIPNFSNNEDLQNLFGGTYEVTLVDENLCSDSLSIDLESYVGIQDVLLENDLILFPNPSNGISKIVFIETLQEDVDILIYDYKGSLIAKKIAYKNANEIELDCTYCAEGMYHVVVQNEHYSISKKLLIIK